MSFTVHPLAGTEIKAELFAEHLSKILSLLDRVQTGFTITGTSGVSLAGTLEEGKGFIGGYEVGEAGDGNQSLTFVASSTNHVFVRDDGVVTVNQNGTPPVGVGSMKVAEVDTNGSGVTVIRDTRIFTCAFDAAFEADGIKSVGSDPYLQGFRSLLEGAEPYMDLSDTTGGVETITRIRAENGTLQVYNVDPITEVETDLGIDLRDPLGGATFIDYSEKGAANGVATLDASGTHPAAQYRQATDAARGGVFLSDTAALALGAATSAGASSKAARYDHVHTHGDRSADAGTLHAFVQISGIITDAQHGSRAGGSLHSVATSGAAGFMSAADKTILDAATSAQTASTLMKRDSAGRAKVADGAAASDIATKGQVDTVQSNLTAHIGAGGSAHALATSGAAGFMSAADKATFDAATSAATVSTIVIRDVAGRAKFVAAAAAGDALIHGQTAGGALQGTFPSPTLADAVQATIKGRAAGAGTGSPTDLTPAQALAIINTTVVSAAATVSPAVNTVVRLSGALLQTVQLPAVFASDDIIIVVGNAFAGSPKILAASGDTINIYNFASASSGYIQGLGIRHFVVLRGITANSSWRAEQFTGQWSVDGSTTNIATPNDASLPLPVAAASSAEHAVRLDQIGGGALSSVPSFIGTIETAVAATIEPNYVSQGWTHYGTMRMGAGATVLYVAVQLRKTTATAKSEVRVYKSTDNGVTWTSSTVASSASSAAMGTRIAMVVVDDNTVYLAYQDATGTSATKFTKTTNGGTSWSSPVTIDAASAGVADIVFDPTNSARIVVIYDSTTTVSKASRSTDSGATFSAGVTFGGDTNGDSYRVMAHYIAASTIYCGIAIDTGTGGHIKVLKSTDNGATWTTPFDDSFSSGHTSQILSFYMKDTNVGFLIGTDYYNGNGTQHLYRTTDGWATFIDLSLPYGYNDSNSGRGTRRAVKIGSNVYALFIVYGGTYGPKTYALTMLENGDVLSEDCGLIGGVCAGSETDHTAEFAVIGSRIFVPYFVPTGSGGASTIAALSMKKMGLSAVA